jgi:hypothetical protein
MRYEIFENGYLMTADMKHIEYLHIDGPLGKHSSLIYVVEKV